MRKGRSPTRCAGERPSCVAAAPRHAGVYHEDRLFKSSADYLCVPFQGGAIALAARLAR
jgi:hypothetical protein